MQYNITVSEELIEQGTKQARFAPDMLMGGSLGFQMFCIKLSKIWVSSNKPETCTQNIKNLKKVNSDQ